MYEYQFSLRAKDKIDFSLNKKGNENLNSEYLLIEGMGAAVTGKVEGVIQLKYNTVIVGVVGALTRNRNTPAVLAGYVNNVALIALVGADIRISRTVAAQEVVDLNFAGVAGVLCKETGV